MAKTREYAFVYLFGGIMYGLMEVIWRGHTHWTMTLTGGTALLILYIINIKMSNCNIFLKCLIGASAITLLEFTVGVIINIILKWNVWDYSNRPLNFPRITTMHIRGKFCVVKLIKKYFVKWI